MSKPYRNPYSLELTLARVIGWGWFLWLVVFGIMWITDTEPRSWDEHMIMLFIIQMFAAGFIGEAEKRAAKEFAEHEEKMQRILASRVVT